MTLHLTQQENMKLMLEKDLYWDCCQKFPELMDHFYTFDDSDCHRYASSELTEHWRVIHNRLGEFVDFIVCIGGDGVLLHAAHLFKQSVPPIMAFNLGSLSFLTTFDFENFKEAISGVIYGSPESADTSVCQIPDCYSEGVLVSLRKIGRASCRERV